MSWPPITDGPYWSPSPSSVSPSLRESQTPVLEYNVDTGTFRIKMLTPPWIERGTTARFKFYAEHTIDGAITTYTTALAASVLDANGNQVLVSYATVGTVTADQGSMGQYYVDITANTIMPAGVYVIQWTGAYTPKAGGPALPMQFRRNFRVQVTAAPSKYFLKQTGHFA